LLDPREGVRAEAYDGLDQARAEPETVLVFDPPVAGVWPASASQAPSEDDRLTVGWLPVLPAADRPSRLQLDGSQEQHELTRLLRDVIRAARGRNAEEQADGGTPNPEGILAAALHQLLRAALAAAVGVRSTGERSSKLSWLRRGVLGRRVRSSGRAIATPGAALGLELDEVGVPLALARAVFGPELPADETKFAAAVEGRRVWLKRDPVLHRWGLLPVRVRLVDGSTVRLPASLLGPLGADFDGDTVALFADLPPGVHCPDELRVAALARHPLLGDALFVPSKQYRYGLHLLTADLGRRQALSLDLTAAGAPGWPDGLSARDALVRWISEAVAQPEPRGLWWAILERHALAALEADPGMGLGLMDAGALANLPVVICEAAKSFYRQGDPSRPLVELVLRGESLTLYTRNKPPTVEDPIAQVMVEARLAIGRFGGALRRLLYTIDALAREDVEAAQALTERITQKALSVKAGQPPLRYIDFEQQLALLLAGKDWNLETDDPDPGRRQLLKALEPYRSIWDGLRGRMAREPVAWLDWLRNPHDMPRLVREAADQTLVLPADDLRLGGWRLSAAGSKKGGNLGTA
jgi:hypothetical protein